MKNTINVDYVTKLTQLETVEAINYIKKEIIDNFVKHFSLTIIEDPIICTEQSGVNDDYRMTERPIDFEISGTSLIGELMQGLTKWRRLMGKKLNLSKHSGLLTDSKWVCRDTKQTRINAIMQHEIGFDVLLDEKDVNQSYLINQVKKIISILQKTEDKLIKKYPSLMKKLTDDFLWIEANELQKKMPLLTFSEQLNRFTRDEGPIILYNLESSIAAGIDELRESQDVFNWRIYAKIYVYDFFVEQHLCLASCGITVDRDSLEKQRLINKEIQKIKFDYENQIVKNLLPITFSFNLNKAILDLFLLEKGHIAEVISSVWDEKLQSQAEKRGVEIL